MAQRARVILVHGLWMNAFVMGLMQRRIANCGFDVESYAYPSVRSTLKENAERLAAYCREHSGATLHLVGHSMGGLIALSAAALARLPCLGRIVTVGTPFTGSFSARALERLPFGATMLGACISEWLRSPRADVAQGHEIGVIAGSGGVGLGRLVAPGLPQPNDGVVAVAETLIPGMRDHVVLDVSHTEMLASREVAHQICAFLQHGRFDRGAAGA